MVNYVLSFCKITGASKIFTRNFYLPLLKPLTPKEALRTLRITGKWLLGSKYQHYIPVLKNHREKRSRKMKNYGRKTHKRMEDFTYMMPANLDSNNEQQKILKNILDGKNNADDPNAMYVYTVQDKKYNIVFQSAFELALRDGDIVDVTVSQKSDKILIKLKNLKKIPLELQYFQRDVTNGDENGTITDDENLYCGEAATTADEEKFHHHGKYTMGLAQLFEDKEKQEEKWEEELKRIMRNRKKRKWEGTKAFKEMMKRIMRKFDWKKFEEDAKRVIEEIHAPATENLIAMEIDDLAKTKNVNENFAQRPDLLQSLPDIADIPDIVKALKDATLVELDTNDPNRKISGAQITLPSGKRCFVTGQIVHTEDGDVFMPGQTVENENGTAEYTPGITINIDNKPTLINGLIMGEDTNSPLFLPTHSTITATGQLTFATSQDERPKEEPEDIRQKRRRKLLRIISVVPEEDSDENVKETIENAIIESGVEDMENIEIIVGKDTDLFVDDGDDDTSLSSSTESERELELNKIKHEQERMPDDGMNDLLDSLEKKKQSLKEKLEDLRNLNFQLQSENNYLTVSYVNDADALDAVSKITLEQSAINKLAEILIAITRRTACFKDRNNVRVENVNMDVNIKPTDADLKFNNCSRKLKVLFKMALITANDIYKCRPTDQIFAMHSIVHIMEDTLRNDPAVLNELLKLMNTPFDRLEICDQVLHQLTCDLTNTKLFNLKKFVSESKDCLKYFNKVIDEASIMNVALMKILKHCPEIIGDLLVNVRLRISEAVSEETANEVMQESVVATIRTLMESNFEELLEKKQSTIVDFVAEAMSFAKALDLDEDVINELAKPNINLKILSYDTIELLKRMTIIRQLAEKDYSLKTAIGRIKKNPECARSDPRIKQLIRESAILVSESSLLRSSRDIPYNLLKKENPLALEDYLIRKTRLETPVLISRGNMQIVVPKEASRGVQSGRIPYILLDEKGMTNFKSIHGLSTKDSTNGYGGSPQRQRSKSIDLNGNAGLLENGKADGRRGSIHSLARPRNLHNSSDTDGSYHSSITPITRGRAMSSSSILGRR